MNMWEQLGTEVVGTVTEVIDAFGDNYQNAASATTAAIDRAKVENILAIKNAELSEKRQAEREKIIKNAVYGLLILIAIVTLSFAGIKIAKAIK